MCIQLLAYPFIHLGTRGLPPHFGYVEERAMKIGMQIGMQISQRDCLSSFFFFFGIYSDVWLYHMVIFSHFEGNLI